MRESPGEKTGAEVRQIPKEKYLIRDFEDHWIAHANSDSPSGTLLYNKRNRRYAAASYSKYSFLFPKLARGYASPEDCPVNKNHIPKSDFLLLLALRERIAKSDSIIRIEDRWREFAFKMRRNEAESKSGKPLSEKNWSRALEIANSHNQFEEYVGKWLAGLAHGNRPGDAFRRLATWLDAAERIENEEVPIQYSKFLKSIEIAAIRAQGVPKQKNVREVYERGLSTSQLGGGYGYNGLKKQLGFCWLPAGGRGQAAHKK